jgi:hypothetical protein
MKFMMLVKSALNSQNKPPPKELIEAMGKLEAEARSAGALLDTGGLMPPATGARVTIRGGKMIVTDGPFAEAKEVVGGYAIFEVASKDEALEWSKRFMGLHSQHWKEWEGELEMRRFFEGSCDFAELQCGTEAGEARAHAG